MRQIVLDTETTGLEVSEGHRIIEIGAVELINRKQTNRTFHVYINPEREVDEGAANIHGMRLVDLKDEPVFANIVDDFVEFIQGAELIIHNASFDVGFIDFEFSLLNPPLDKLETQCSILDSLALARSMHPGQRNNLDALCKRYGIDNTQRTLHGALLDSEILADLYLIMTGGQITFLDEHSADGHANNKPLFQPVQREKDLALKVISASATEIAEHNLWLDYLDKTSEHGALWKKLYD